MITENRETFAEIGTPDNPFPGLRPFEFDESHLFFGRDGQSEQLISKLGRTRFLAVVGPSGSGKSSLVRAGLLPTLLAGFMSSAGSGWRIAIMRPGNDPVSNLAAAINAPDVFGSEDEQNQALQIAITEATLRRGSRGLVEAVRQSAIPDNENLLVVVDQFEELFRFAREATRKARDEGERYRNDSAAFVKLLLEAHTQREVNIYVVLTMRSDFLGDSAQFWDLPEAVNESQYLIPRLTRDQMREAITGPVAVAGGEITPRLVTRLLNDIGDDQDQLPVLQHLLMRAWDECKEKRLDVEINGEEGTIRRPHKEVHEGEAVDLCCYEAVGGMAEALSRHADEAFNDLPDDRHRQIAEKLFKCLTEKGEDNREIRRPITLAEICAVTEASATEVKTVIETFRLPGRSFLMPPAETPLDDNSLIDISHESLIRGWQRLREWVNEEARSARVYRRLAETAELNLEGKAGLWGDPDLQVALDWQENSKPNRDWAMRYQPGFETAMAFLRASEKKRAEAASRRRYFIAALAAMALLAMGAAVFAGFAYRNANEQRQNAVQQQKLAEDQKKKSDQLFYVANMNLAQKAFEDGDMIRLQELLNTFLPASATPNSDNVRGFDWYYLWRHNPYKATLEGHIDFVSAVAFSPDGKMLASGSADDTVKLWDVNTRQELATLKGHASAVLSVTFSPDGKMLASSSLDKTVKLWDVNTRQELATLEGHIDFVGEVAFSPDGKMLASSSLDKTVRLWDVNTRQELATLRGHLNPVSSVAFSPDGKMLASSSLDNKVKLWDVNTRQELATLKGHTNPVWSVTFSPDGKTLASGSDDRTVKLWDVSTRQELATLKGHAGPIRSVAFSPDGKTIASGSQDYTVKLWDVNTRQELATLRGHLNPVSSVAFSPDGKMLASSSLDKTVKLWDVNTQQEPATLRGHANPVSSVAFSPDGKTLASGSADDTVKLWDVNTRQELATLKGHANSVWSVAFSPDGKMLASGSQDYTVKLWDVNTRQELATLRGHLNPVSSVAFSPDGKTIASGSDDNTVKLWDVNTRQELATLRGHTNFVSSVAFSPDGKMLASGSRDETVRLWDVNTRQELATLRGHTNFVSSVAFSPDGKTIASGSDDKTAKLWDVSTRQELATLKGHTNPVLSVAFSPDGKTLASGCDDKTVKLWDVNTRQELATLKGHMNAVSSITFSPDGKTLASGCDDETVRLWFAATDEEVAAQRSK